MHGLYRKWNINHFSLGRGWGSRRTTQPSPLSFTSSILGWIFGRGSIDGGGPSIWCGRTCLETTAPTFNKISQALPQGPRWAEIRTTSQGSFASASLGGDLLPMSLLHDWFLISLPTIFVPWVLDQWSRLPLLSPYFTQNLCLVNTQLSWPNS